MNPRWFIVFVILVICAKVHSKEKTTAYDIGILNLFSTSETEATTICLNYPMDYFIFQPEVTYALNNLSHINLCEHNLTSTDLNNTGSSQKTLFLLSADGNCSVSSNFPVVAENGAGLILISEYRYKMNNSYGLEVFAVVHRDDSHGFWNFNSTDPLFVHLFGGGGGGFDGSTAVLGIIAVVCVVIGSYSSPYGAIPGRTSNEPRILENSEGSDSNTNQAKPNEVPINVATVLVLVIFITITLLLLYFFYKYLVFVFIGIFCIASTRATYCIFLQLICCFDFGINPPKIRNYGLHELLLAAACLSVTIVWFIFRNTSFSWILQDFLGICFCIHVIQTLRLPNLKICALLLSMLFIYDIFFVFITPLFMQNGKSIMVEVATGGGSDSAETIPLLLKIPRLQSNPAAVCTAAQYSLLGFGDIIIPGLLVCFAHTFDILSGARYRPYFISTSIGYTVGLFGAFIALYLMRIGQPALLYIVPAVLLAIFSLGACRKETKALWQGTIPQINAVSDIGA